MKKIWWYIWHYFPYLGGLLCIFYDKNFYHKNKEWFVPYHWVTGMVMGILIIGWYFTC